ncbi:MAG: DUF1801 domain-containing protein [Bauldia sp.]|nr:DUF1801 domain-containing protein [Bauldia sp.]
MPTRAPACCSARVRGMGEVAMKTVQKSAKKSAAKSGGFSAEERQAMKDRADELKAARRGGSKADKEAAAEQAVVDRIAEMPEPDRSLGQRLHALIKEAAPQLKAKLWYGMPAYALGDDMICHFQDAAKFKSRYPTLGFSDKAKLDDGTMWPVAFGITRLTAADEARIIALVKKAAG